MADYAQPEKRAEEKAGNLYDTARKALSEELEKVSTAFQEGTNMLSLLLLNPETNKSQMLPRRRKINDQIMVEETTNGSLLLRIGCNLWAFNDPTELCIVLCFYLRNPEQMSRISAVLTRRNGNNEGIGYPGAAPVPEGAGVATVRGSW